MWPPSHSPEPKAASDQRMKETLNWEPGPGPGHLWGFSEPPVCHAQGLFLESQFSVTCPEGTASWGLLISCLALCPA